MDVEKTCCNCEFSYTDDSEYDTYFCPLDPVFAHHSLETCNKFRKSRFLVMLENGTLHS